jgi:nucleotide-binding universal stress UspA family protein
VLTHLDKRGEGRVVWFGGVPEGADAPWILPTHPRLEMPGWVDRETLHKAFSGATAALDWMSPNPERQLAFSFRHADYLGCGLPILTHTDSPLADVLGDAGWASDHIEDTLDAVLDHPKEVAKRSKAARTLARTSFSMTLAMKPLLDWVMSGTRHAHSPTDLLDLAQLAADAARAQETSAAANAAQGRAEAEVAVKRAEVAQLNTQVQTLMRSIDRLTRAIDEVAGFKREAIHLLGNQGAADRLSLDEAVAENALLRADTEKKSAELRAMDELRARLENDVSNLRKEVNQLQQRGIFRR